MRYTGGKGPNSAFMAHCQQELLHGQWATLLDDEFMDAYLHGLVVLCCDGIKHSFFSRIMIYSADYPEK
jgi:hypothetical protein